MLTETLKLNIIKTSKITTVGFYYLYFLQSKKMLNALKKLYQSWEFYNKKYLFCYPMSKARKKNERTKKKV